MDPRRTRDPSFLHGQFNLSPILSAQPHLVFSSVRGRAGGGCSVVLAARSFPSAALDGVCGGGAQCSSPFPFELRQGGALSTSLLPLAAAGCGWGTLLTVAFPVPAAAEELLLLLNEGAHAVLHFFHSHLLRILQAFLTRLRVMVAFSKVGEIQRSKNSRRHYLTWLS